MKDRKVALLISCSLIIVNFKLEYMSVNNQYIEKKNKSNNNNFTN